MQTSRIVFIGFLFATIAALANTWMPLSAPAHVDTEVRTNVVMRAWDGDAQKFRFELVLDATPSNNVEVAFGVDRNQNGLLDIRETRMIVGWRCGEWFLRDAPIAEEFKEVSSTDTRKTLSCEMYLTNEGAPQSLTIKDGDTSLFEDILTPNIPEWLFSRDWNIMSLTARGVDAQHERFFFEQSSTGIIIYFQ